MFSSTSFQSILLALQCVLIVWLFAGQPGGADQKHSQQSVVSIEKTALNTITISANDVDKVVLKKQDGNWILPDYYNLTVNTGLLDQMLEKLAAARSSWPIAQTADAAERFHVSSTNYKRHLRLQCAADVVEDLYLGDSPGLRKIYIRNEDADAIYTIEFGLHLVPASADQWFNKNLLKPGRDIKEIHAADFVLSKKADDWDMNDLAEQEVLVVHDRQAVRRRGLAGQLLQPRRQTLGHKRRDAPPIDVVDVGMPNSSYDLSSMRASINGVPLPQDWVSVEEELRYIRVFFQLGVRMMHLTYNRRNVIGDGCAEPGNAGLSDFGRAVVQEMNRVGVIVDVAHSG